MPRLRLLLIVLVPLILAITVAATDAGRPLDNALRAQREWIRRHDATGQVVVVEIDAGSLARLHHWPWPRSYYATAIKALSEAGAESIALDIDFSSPSTDAEDAALVDAMQRSHAQIIVPTFRQLAGGRSRDIIEDLPIPAIQNVAFLASVNVYADEDGLLRSYAEGTTTQGETRPSLASYLAAVPGDASRSFQIDYAINPESLPQYSFADVVEGRLSPSVFAGKKVLIGATAVELGDRYAAPGRGVLPGVFVQALAAETLLQGARNPSRGPWPGLILAGCAAAVFMGRSARRKTAALGAVSVGVLGLPLIAEQAHLGTMDCAPGLALLVAAAAGNVFCETLATLRNARFTDLESGLPNRAAFAEASVASGDLVVVANFARAADALTIITPELRSAVRGRLLETLTAAARGATLYRLDADLYAWVVNAAQAMTLEADLQAAASLFDAPLSVGGESVVMKPNFGYCAIVGEDLQEAHDCAALASRRGAQLNAAVLGYDPEMAEDVSRARRLLADVSRGLAEGQFAVAYQPKLELRTGRITGAEALVRWNHPQFAAVNPAEFIPLLENDGGIADVTWFVIDRVLADIGDWRRQGAQPSVAINISVRIFDDPSFPAALAARVSAAGVPPAQITLEVTESAAIGSADATVTALEELRRTGFKISVDDYGTGQSTLTYLRHFPAQEIKIDQAFIRAMRTDAHDQILVRSTIDLAHALDLMVVGEGVEDQATLALLREIGCDMAQGWAVGRPMSADDFLRAATTNVAPVLTLVPSAAA